MGRIKVEVERIKPKKVFETAKEVYQTFMGLDTEYFKDLDHFEKFKREISNAYGWRYGDGDPGLNKRKLNRRRLNKKKRIRSREAIGDIRDMCFMASTCLLKIPEEMQQFLNYDGEE